MRFASDFERIFTAILNGSFDQAEGELMALAPESISELRAVAHFRAIITFNRGDVAQAKCGMESALQSYGENVNLLRDLAVCQYHLSDMGGFRTSLARVQTVLNELGDQLSWRSLLDCELTVGKLLEEEARLVPALMFYDRALGRAQTASQRLRILTQKARWHALYQPNEELSDYYREMISADRERSTRDLNIELEHSLMLIELRLVGADHAWLRVNKWMSAVDELDRRLLFYDFIEGALSQDLELPAAVYQLIGHFNNLSPFEKFIEKLVQGSLEAEEKLEELTLLATRISWSSYLQLLCLAANREPSTSTRQELDRKIQLIIRSLDSGSQRLWLQRLKEALQTPEIRLEYSSRKRLVSVQGRVVDLSKKKLGLSLLESLTTRSEISIDDAIQILWQSRFSPEHYHRLRMSVHRLNTLINKITGLGKIIEVDSQTVRLRPEVRIRRSDDLFDAYLLN